jgi:hypothetical protein
MMKPSKTGLWRSSWPSLAALAALGVVIVVFGRGGGCLGGYGAPLILLGGAALSLVGFSGREIAAAFRDAARGPFARPTRRISAFFWESLARDFWMMGALTSVLSFIDAFNRLAGSGSGGIAAVASAMAAALLPSVLGLTLAALCLVPAWKITAEARLAERELGSLSGSRPAAGATERTAPRTVAGYVFFIGLIAWTVVQSSLSPATSMSPFKAWTWLFYWPAILIVLGGTLAFALYAGRSAAGPPLTASFGLTALAGSLAGLVQVLMSFASKDIRGVTAGITLTISSCFVGSLGILLAGAPWEVRMVKDGRLDKPSALSRAVWAFFPLLTLFILALAFIFVITPIQR